jgi:hypothetical protein
MKRRSCVLMFGNRIWGKVESEEKEKEVASAHEHQRRGLCTDHQHRPLARIVVELKHGPLCMVTTDTTVQTYKLNEIYAMLCYDLMSMRNLIFHTCSLNPHPLPPTHSTARPASSTASMYRPIPPARPRRPSRRRKTRMGRYRDTSPFPAAPSH